MLVFLVSILTVSFQSDHVNGTAEFPSRKIWWSSWHIVHFYVSCKHYLPRYTFLQVPICAYWLSCCLLLLVLGTEKGSSTADIEAGPDGTTIQSAQESDLADGSTSVVEEEMEHNTEDLVHDTNKPWVWVPVLVLCQQLALSSLLWICVKTERVMISVDSTYVVPLCGPIPFAMPNTTKEPHPEWWDPICCGLVFLRSR